MSSQQTRENPVLIAAPACFICSSTRVRQVLTVEKYPILGCRDCGNMAMYPQPPDEALAAIYGSQYQLLIDTRHRDELKRHTAQHYLKLIARYRGTNGFGGVAFPAGGTLLEIGCGSGEFLAEAVLHDYSVTGLEISPTACEQARSKIPAPGRIINGDISAAPGQYDVVVLNDVIEHVRDPRATLEKVRALLHPGGTIFLATPSLNSWSARLMRSRWVEFKLEHLHYFRPKTLSRLLADCGFDNIRTKPGVKTLSMEYIMAHFWKYPVQGFEWVGRLPVPGFLRHRPIRLVASGMIVIASKLPS